MIHVKLTSAIYKIIQADLDRPHPFALERIGFAFARQSLGDDGSLTLLVTDYHPIPDAQYIRDDSVGAKINSAAIKFAIERSMTSKESIFHIHRHEHYGNPRFGKTDVGNFLELIPSFHNTGANVAHGALVFSFNKATGIVWLTKYEQPLQTNDITVVGYPLCFQFRKVNSYGLR